MIRKKATAPKKHLIAPMKEKLGKAIFTMAAILAVVSVIAIFVFLTVRSFPAFQKIGFFDFLLGETWSPDRLDRLDQPLSGRYGILTMIAGTLTATFGALLVGGILGFFTAVFLAFYCPKRLKGVFTSIIHLLAGIPSVVYGFFGIVFLLPLLAQMAPNNGSGLLATSLILGIMILPTVVSLSRTALDAVPRSYYEGALATGANHTDAVFRVMVPAARSGITASLVLGLGRALGETMAVVMVAGNAPTYPDGLFSSFRTLTANIVMEMGYAGEVQEGALVATGVVLLFFVLLVNLLFSFVSERAIRRAVGARKEKAAKRSALSSFYEKVRSGVDLVFFRVRAVRVAQFFAILSGLFAVGALLLILGFLFYKGLPTLLRDTHLLFGKYEFGSERITILPSLVATLLAVLLSLAIALPIGIMTAIFLNEYAQKSSRPVRLLRTAIDILAGVPSIVYGLFGMISFLPLFGGSASILAGSFTVSLMLLPVVVRSTEESLKAVPDSLREGSLALGAGKLRTTMRIVLPSAASGILSAAILSIGRVISESAPFLYTMGSVISAVPNSYTDSGATLAVALYQLSGEGWYMDEAYATAVVLILLVFTLNLIAGLVAKKVGQKQR